jgi:hypothetical protein
VFEVKIAVVELKTYKSPGSDQIMIELIQTEGEILQPEIQKLIISVLRKEDLPEQWKVLLYQFTRRAMNECANYRGVSL